MSARRLSLHQTVVAKAGLAGITVVALGLALGAQTSCKGRGVCDDVEGPCLALTVTGDSTVAAAAPLTGLRTTLQIDALTKRDGLTAGAVELPVTLRLLPPEGLTASTVQAIAVTGVRDGSDVARGQTEPGFTWPEDAHIEATVQLTSLDPGPGPDGGGDVDMAVPPSDMAKPPADMVMPPADMAIPPLPTLKWTAESPAGLRQELHDVWTTTGLTLAVGTGGVILSRGMTGAWTQEASPASGDLWSVAINSAGTAWTSGSNTTFRRGMGWAADNTGLTGSGTLWSVSPGAAVGELWAAGDGGKVWRRNAADGRWTSETALPNNTTVTAVHYVDGVVFAVGKDGYAAVRTTAWQPATQYMDLRGQGLYGVWGLNKSTAFAVGSKGLLVRFSADKWQPTPQRIEPSQNELNAVWASSFGRAWAVGYNGLIVRVDGTTAVTLRTDNSQDLYSISGRSESDLFAVGVARSGTAVILHGAP